MPARILVVEDNSANLDLMTYLLRAFGHVALGAIDGQDGYDKARLESPDLIVCDIQLPKLNGYEVVRKLKANPSLKAIPVVAVTAFAMVGDRDKILDAGFDGYIPKPIEPTTFVAEVDRYLPASHHAPGVRGTESHSEFVATDTEHPLLGTILLIDSSDANLSMLQSILEPSGYVTRSAKTIIQAIRLASESKPNLILSDHRLPDGSHLQLLHALRGISALIEIPIFIISSPDHRRVDHEVSTFGAQVHFLNRPIEPETLLAEIHGCLKR